MPKLVWEPVDQPTNKASEMVDLTRQTPLMQGQGMQKTHSMIDMAHMAMGDSVSLFPLDGPVVNPFANRTPGQRNGYAPSTTTSGGYPVRDNSVVVFPLDDPQPTMANGFQPMTGNGATIGQPVMIVAADAPTSLTRAMPVVALQPPISAQAALPTPFTNGALTPNIMPPQPATEPANRRTLLTGY